MHSGAADTRHVKDESESPAVKEGPRISRLLVEGLVIVVSVLLALAGDAWWASVQERDVEGTYMRQLRADLVKMDEEVGDWLAVEQGHLASALYLLEYLDSDETGTPADSVQTWFLRTWSSPMRRLSDGTLRDLIGSGSLRVIQNDSVRTLLSSFVQSVDDTQARLTQLESNFTLLIGDPYFQSNVRLWGMYSEETKVRRGIPGGRRFSVDFERIRHDREFGNVIMRGYVYKLNRIDALAGLKAATEELRAALEDAAK